MNKCTLSGEPANSDCVNTGAPQPLDEITGQYKDYYILCDNERKELIRPIRTKYIHQRCGELTTMNKKIAETYAVNPKFYGSTFCVHCGKHYPVSEFRWEDSTVVGS